MVAWTLINLITNKTYMNQTFFERFIEELNANFSKNYSSIAEVVDNEYRWSEIDSVRSEICKCIICGFNQAAITT